MFAFLAPLFAALGGGGAAVAGSAVAAGGLGAAITAAAPDLLGAALSMNGANKARRQSIEDGQNKFVDLRNAAIRGGFNPLTALEATGGAGYGAGAYPSSAAPLASVELLTGAFRKGAAELDGSAARQRSTDALNNDLARIKLDQARSGVLLPRPARARQALPLSKTPLAGTDTVVPQYITVWDGLTGNRFPYINPDLTDMGPVEAATGIAGLSAAQTAYLISQGIGVSTPVVPKMSVPISDVPPSSRMDLDYSPSPTLVRPAEKSGLPSVKVPSFNLDRFFPKP